MNRKQASKTLLKGISSIGEAVTPWGVDVVLSHYWIVPRVWLDETILAHARIDLDDIPAPNERWFRSNMELTAGHAELAWPHYTDVGAYEMGVALHQPDYPGQTLYLCAVRDDLSGVRADWFDAIADLSAAAGCGDLFMWAKSAVAPIVYADADETPVAAVMSVRLSAGVAAALTEFAGGVS